MTHAAKAKEVASASQAQREQAEAAVVAAAEAEARAQASAAAAAAAAEDGSDLPFGGDLQAAMAAQDRGAVRRIMAAKGQAHSTRRASQAPPRPAGAAAGSTNGGGGGASAGARAAEGPGPGADTAELPYGGDLGAAMKAQDRAAIRTIMAANKKTMK